MYSIPVTNANINDAHGSHMKLTLPANMRNIFLTCISATNGAVCPADVTYPDGTEQIDVTLETFPKKGILSFELRMRVPHTPPTSLPLTAEVSVPEGMFDSTPSNNTAQHNIGLTTAETNLRVTKVSQSMTGVLETTEVLGDSGVVTNLEVTNPEPISFTVKYENA